MDIQGPIKIGVVNDPETSGWELHLTFTDDFKAENLARQGQIFAEYASELACAIDARQEGDQDRAGMLIVQQLAEQLQPYIQAGEMALEETMVVEIGQNQAFSVTDFLNA